MRDTEPFWTLAMNGWTSAETTVRYEFLPDSSSSWEPER